MPRIEEIKVDDSPDFNGMSESAFIVGTESMAAIDQLKAEQRLEILPALVESMVNSLHDGSLNPVQLQDAVESSRKSLDKLSDFAARLEAHKTSPEHVDTDY